LISQTGEKDQTTDWFDPAATHHRRERKSWMGRTSLFLHFRTWPHYCGTSSTVTRQFPALLYCQRV